MNSVNRFLQRLFQTLPVLAAAVGAPVSEWWAPLQAKLPEYTTAVLPWRCSGPGNQPPYDARFF
jgi:hypothetical protein